MLAVGCLRGSEWEAMCLFWLDGCVVAQERVAAHMLGLGWLRL